MADVGSLKKDWHAGTVFSVFNVLENKRQRV